MIQQLIYIYIEQLTYYLENFKDAFYKIINDKKYILFIVILIIIFTSAFVFVYNTYISKEHSLNREFIDSSKNTTKDVLILYFYTEWCPYCKQESILSEIKNFEDYIIESNEKNDFIITLTKIDCDKNSTIADKYKVEGYPTIKLIYKNNVYNYYAKPTKDSLIQFVESSIA